MPKVNRLDLDVLVDQALAIRDEAIDYGEYSPITGIFLYRYHDMPDGCFERVAFVIDDKFHWLDLKNFSLHELQSVAECLNVAISTTRQRWGIYPKGSILTTSRSRFVVSSFHRDVDLTWQLPKALAKLSVSGGDDLEWEVSALAEEYELYDEDELCDEYGEVFS